jgi:hypothetical protein
METGGSRELDVQLKPPPGENSSRNTDEHPEGKNTGAEFDLLYEESFKSLNALRRAANKKRARRSIKKDSVLACLCF